MLLGPKTVAGVKCKCSHMATMQGLIVKRGIDPKARAGEASILYLYIASRVLLSYLPQSVSYGTAEP